MKLNFIAAFRAKRREAAERAIREAKAEAALEATYKPCSAYALQQRYEMGLPLSAKDKRPRVSV